MYAAAITAVIPLLLGILVLARSSQRLIGWLLVAHGLSVGLILGWSSLDLHTDTVDAVGQFTQGTWVLLYVWLALIVYLSPNGHAASPRWRVWIAVGLGGCVVFAIGAAGDAGADGVVWMPEAIAQVLGIVGLAVVVAFLFGAVPSVVLRMRAASGEERRQLLWLVWGALGIPIALLAVWTDLWLFGGQQWVQQIALVVATVSLPVAIAGAILAHRLFDIRVILSRTLTYTILTVCVLAAYALVVFAAQRVFGDRTIGGLLAIGIVAVGIHPLHAWLRARIERLVYGYRARPHEALRLLDDRADTAREDDFTASVTQAVADALRVGRAYIDQTGGPELSPGEVRVPLSHRGVGLGELVVVVPDGRVLSASDTALLHDLARHAGVLVHAQRLNDDLRESRSRIVAAREEERRRIRRDLHDGLGPALAAVVLMLNAAENRSTDPAASSLVADARGEVREAVDEVRRLVDGLRPPALDEVGLLAAIRQRAQSVSGGLVVEVDGPDALPVLPAAIEVAAYRIVGEALTNAIRHSGATRCRVVVELDDVLCVTVSDNGSGLAPGAADGVGWVSMQERAAEVGGRCERRTSPSGLTVRAELPLVTVPEGV